MLDKIRENSRSIGTYIIFGIIIVVFVAYFGPGSGGCLGLEGQASGPTFAIKVNGDEIPMREFEGRYDRIFRTYAAQMGGKMTPEMAEQFHLKDTLLDQMIDAKLQLQAARSLGLSISDADLAVQLRKITSFQKNGHFDYPTYKAFLEANGRTPDTFETEIRDDLLRERLTARLRLAAVVTDEEIKDRFDRDNDRAKLAYARFPAAVFLAEATPTPEEVKAALEGPRKAEFDQQYQRQKLRFSKPKRVSAQHILVKVEEDAPTSAVDAARKSIDAARARIAGGEDFGKVAKELSDDPGSKEKGGDLGFFGPGTMAQPFEEAAMALAPGQMSEPVRTRFGWHIIKVNEVQAPTETPQDEAYREIATEILHREKSEALAMKKAEESLATARTSGKPLTELFPRAPEGDNKKPAGVFSDETTLFQAESEYIPAIGTSPEIAADLAKVTEAGGLLPRAYKVSSDGFIAQVLERKLPDAAELETKKEEIRDQLIRQKQQVMVDAYTKQLRKGAVIEKNPLVAGGEEPPPPPEG